MRESDAERCRPMLATREQSLESKAERNLCLSITNPKTKACLTRVIFRKYKNLHATGEKARISAAGGFVDFGRVNGNLALSRAIGDFEFKKSAELAPEQQIVTAFPDVVIHDVSDDDEFLVIACDGENPKPLKIGILLTIHRHLGLPIFASCHRIRQARNCR